jgi:hypothetical protein
MEKNKKRKILIVLLLLLSATITTTFAWYWAEGLKFSEFEIYNLVEEVVLDESSITEGQLVPQGAVWIQGQVEEYVYIFVLELPEDKVLVDDSLRVNVTFTGPANRQALIDQYMMFTEEVSYDIITNTHTNTVRIFLEPTIPRGHFQQLRKTTISIEFNFYIGPTP